MADQNTMNFVEGDFVVYPAHGVGQIEGIETQTIAGMELSLYAISFEKERMRLKIPVAKAEQSGLRKLSSDERLGDAIQTAEHHDPSTAGIIHHSIIVSDRGTGSRVHILPFF